MGTRVGTGRHQWICRTVEAAIGLHRCGLHFADGPSCSPSAMGPASGWPGSPQPGVTSLGEGRNLASDPRSSPISASRARGWATIRER